MTTTETRMLLQHLYSQITTDLQTIATYNEHTGDWQALPEATEDTADENSRADRTEDWGERQATVAQLETRFRNIKRALTKLEAGTYGVCEITGEPIEPDRLAANPAARTCKNHLNEESLLPL